MSEGSEMRRGMAVFIGLACALLMPGTALADEGLPKDGDQFAAYLMSHGVSEENALRAAEKYESGAIMDADRGDVFPASVQQGSGVDVIERTMIFPDGSVRVEEVSNLQAAKERGQRAGGAMPASVSGCSYRSGGNYAGYWRNCFARASTWQKSLHVYFDYSNVRGRGVRIDRYHGAGGSASSGSLSGVRVDRPASNQLAVYGEFHSGGATSTCRNKVTATSNGASTAWACF